MRTFQAAIAWMVTFGCSALPAADYTLSTIAGLAKGAEPTRADTVQFAGAFNVLSVQGDNLLYGDGNTGSIHKLELPTGGITRFAPAGTFEASLSVSGITFGSTDSPAVVADAAGNVYVATDAHVQKMDPSGNLTTIAGRRATRGAIDGPGATARFSNIAALALNSTATRLYVLDTGNHTVRVIDLSTTVVSTLAGKAMAGGFVDGTGEQARFNLPNGLTMSGDDELFVVDTFNQAIRRVTSSGQVTTFAGGANGATGAFDGIGAGARFFFPLGIVADGNRTLYVADKSNHAIRAIDRISGQVTTLAGSSQDPGYVDGRLSEARFNAPSSLALDRARNHLYVAEPTNALIRRIDLGTREVTTTAGVFIGRDGPVDTARFSFLQGIAAAPNGALYVADSFSFTLRKIQNGMVTTVAGKTYVPGEVDGPPGVSRLNFLSFLVSDAQGNIYFSGLHTVRKLSAAGDVTTVAGGADEPGSNDGPARQARFHYPRGIGIDRAGNLLVADTSNHAIRKISPAGIVTTLAGNVASPGIADGPAATARFDVPLGLAIDSRDNIYVTDSQTVRRISADGIVTTLAGVAYTAGFRDAAGAEARFNGPEGIAVDATGAVFVADYQNRVVRRITPEGVVTTVAGQPGAMGDEDGDWGRFSTPVAIAVGTTGALFVTDWARSTVRALTTTSSNTRFTNLSVRATTAPNEQTLIAGFSISGADPKRIIVRSVGPTLAQFGVAGALSDPLVDLFSAAGATRIAGNDDWGGDAAMRDAMAAVGAFPLGPRDAAIALNATNGGYSAHALGKDASGVVLLEVYDRDGPTTLSRLSNLSVRGTVSSTSALIAGFVLRGDLNRTVLLRGLGPALRGLGVSGALNNPVLRVFASDGRLVAENDDWLSQPESGRVSAAAGTAGAVALTPNGRDAALLISLRPGSYTVHVSTAPGDTGTALIEAYDLP